MDFTADGRFALATCEFSGQLIRIDLRRERTAGIRALPDGPAGMPQDVKLSPDGRIFYVADMHADGLWEVSAATTRVVGFSAREQECTASIPAATHGSCMRRTAAKARSR
jgi:hypothetical protein